MDDGRRTADDGAEAGPGRQTGTTRRRRAGRAVKIALYNVTTTTKVGGVETFVWEVAAQLVARGYQADVIGGRGAERRAVPGVRVVTLPYLDRAFWRRIPLLGRQ